MKTGIIHSLSVCQWGGGDSGDRERDLKWRRLRPVEGVERMSVIQIDTIPLGIVIFLVTRRICIDGLRKKHQFSHFVDGRTLRFATKSGKSAIPTWCRPTWCRPTWCRLTWYRHIGLSDVGLGLHRVDRLQKTRLQYELTTWAYHQSFTHEWLTKLLPYGEQY